MYIWKFYTTKNDIHRKVKSFISQNIQYWNKRGFIIWVQIHSISLTKTLLKQRELHNNDTPSSSKPGYLRWKPFYGGIPYPGFFLQPVAIPQEISGSGYGRVALLGITPDIPGTENNAGAKDSWHFLVFVHAGCGLGCLVWWRTCLTEFLLWHEKNE